MITRIFTVPNGLKAAGDAFFAALGWGGPVFVQPLSPNGRAQITHWGFPCTWTTEAESDAFEAIMADPPPGHSQVLSQLRINTRKPTDAPVEGRRAGDRAHWQNEIAAQGLVVVPQHSVQE